jgi:hypothetical protein
MKKGDQTFNVNEITDFYKDVALNKNVKKGKKSSHKGGDKYMCIRMYVFFVRMYLCRNTYISCVAYCNTDACTCMYI